LSRGRRAAPLVVHEFAGTSLGSAERIAAASELLVREGFLS
jgi:hypothetical protein